MRLSGLGAKMDGSPEGVLAMEESFSDAERAGVVMY
jgi:hypothetical protein